MTKRLIDMDVDDLRELITSALSESINKPARLTRCLTRTQAGKYIGCHPNTIDSHAKSGKLAFVQYGKQRRFQVSVLDEFLESNTKQL